jgi:hypothetical protein
MPIKRIVKPIIPTIIRLICFKVFNIILLSKRSNVISY